MSIKKIALAITLLVSGCLLWIYRMQVVHASIGKTRTKIGQWFGVDRLHYFILSIQIAAGVLVAAGLFLLFLRFRRIQKNNKKPPADP